MSVLEAEKLAKQIKLNQGKGLYFVERLSEDFAQAVAEEVGVVCVVKVCNDGLEVATVTPCEGGLDDSSMERIIDLFSELEPEGERRIINGEDVYLLDLQRGYELVLDKDSFLQQQLPILVDSSLLTQLKSSEAEQ